MAIYEQGYRPYLGPRQALSSRPWVIARHAIQGVWRRRAVKVILIGVLFIVLGASIFLYLGWQAFGLSEQASSGFLQGASFEERLDGNTGITPKPPPPIDATPLIPSSEETAQENFPSEIVALDPEVSDGEIIPQEEFPPFEENSAIYQEEYNDAQLAQQGLLSVVSKKPSLGFALLYQWTMIWQGVSVFFLAMSVLCGLIAHDRKSGAIPLYLTRSVTRNQYLLGKLLAASGLCAFVLLVPILIMGILDFGFSSPGHNIEILSRVLGAFLSGILWSLLIGTTVVAVSTLTSRPRLASVFCAIAAFAPLIIASILVEIFYASGENGVWIFDLLSPVFLALQTTSWFLGTPSLFAVGVDAASQTKFYEPILLMIWVCLLFLFAAWRIRRLGETRE